MVRKQEYSSGNARNTEKIAAERGKHALSQLKSMIGSCKGSIEGRRPVINTYVLSAGHQTLIFEPTNSAPYPLVSDA